MVEEVSLRLPLACRFRRVETMAAQGSNDTAEIASMFKGIRCYIIGVASGSHCNSSGMDDLIKVVSFGAR